MSIINEALKKAGQPILTEIKDARKGPRAMNWGPVFVIGVLLVIGAPILTPILRDSRSSDGSARQTAVGPEVSHPEVRRQFGVEETALPRTAQGMGPRFAMSGLVFSNETSYCLINGKVLKVGDAVGEARLVRITPDSAVLEYRGQQIVLPASA